MAYMNAETHTPYRPVELQTRHTFVGFVTTACSELGVTCTWYSDDWIARLTHGGRTRYIHGYTFPVNNASASAIIDDKAATFTVLQQAGIAAIPHYLLRLHTEYSTQSTADYALSLASLPVVIKPNEGKTSGAGVIKCETRPQAERAIFELAANHQALAVSPLANIAHEYRVVVLNNTAKVVFEKQRRPNTWHHNLTKGAVPQLLTDGALRTKLERFAVKTTQALSANLAAVDIAETPAGLQIMEVNAGIMLNTFSLHSQKNAAIAQRVYTAIVAASFGSIKC